MKENYYDIWFVYADGHVEKFTGNNLRKNIAKIGIVFQGHKFAVALRDLPYHYPLVSDTDKCEINSPLYKNEIDSIFDWNVELRMKHLVDAGAEIPIKDGEFIPTAAMLVAMYYMREKLNKALVFAGGNAFKTDDFYWSCSECGQRYAWMLNFGSGYLGYCYKRTYGYIRPCTSFNL